VCRLLEEPGSGGLIGDLYSSAAKYAPASRSWVVGITGAPGVGKSTLVSSLVAELRGEFRKVAVLAIDPSSPFSGGALLGDRIRMERHVGDDGVYIHSLASRGASGGIARSTADLVVAARLWGAQCVVVETVGVGQNEHDVMLMADTTVLVVAPGQGDDIQANKAGIIEAADVVVVNKADRPGASQLASMLRGALALSGAAKPALHHGVGLAPRESTDADWAPPVLECIARDGSGVAEVEECLRRHRTWGLGESGRERRELRRRLAAERRIELALVDALRASHAPQLHAQAELVARGANDPDAAAREILRLAAAD
jgi:LAO/AO transport system kinase